MLVGVGWVDAPKAASALNKAATACGSRVGVVWAGGEDCGVAAEVMARQSKITRGTRLIISSKICT